MSEEILLQDLMTPNEFEATGVAVLSDSQRAAIWTWALRTSEAISPRVSAIQQVKYEGRSVALEDGSRWEVDRLDSSDTSYWGVQTPVLIHEDTMYNLESADKVKVSKDEVAAS